MKSALSHVVFLFIAGTLAACSGGGESDSKDASTGDAGADPVLELLARPHVKEALAAAAAAGYPIITRTEPNPPPIAGYYLKPFGEGRFVASGNGANLTSTLAGNETRIDVAADASVTEASVSFTTAGIFGSGISSGKLLRGANDEFTLYLTGTGPCPIQGTNLVTEAVTIQSGRFVATTGDWETVRYFNVTTAATGSPAGCETAYAGDTEVPGGWIVGEVPRQTRITVEDLQYMCVDEGAGYVAGESWTRADGTDCFCDDYFLVDCG